MVDTRIVFNLKGKDVGDVVIKDDTAAAGHVDRRTVVIGELVNDGVDRLHAQRMDNAAFANATGKAATDFRVAAGAGKAQNSFRNVEIICKDEREARKLVQLLHLKHSLVDLEEDGVTAAVAKFRFWIENIKYDESKAHGGVDYESFVMVAGNNLILNTLGTSDATNGNGIANGLKDIKINNVTLADGTAVANIAKQTYNAQRTKLESIWTEIDKLVKHFITDNKDDLDTTHFADAATSPLSVLNDIKTKSAIANSVESFVYARTASVRDEVDYWIGNLSEFKIWYEVAGVKKVSNILKANINGFTITDRAGGAGTIATDATNGNNLNITEQKKKRTATTAPKTTVADHIDGEKYLGWPIYDEGQAAAAAGADDATHLFNKSFATNNKGKTEIEAFHTVFYDTTKGTKEDFRGFSPEENFTGVTAATDSKDATAATYATKNIMDTNWEIKGRKDGEKIVAGTKDADLTFKNDDLKFTKTVFDLARATSKNDIVTILLGTDFDTAIGTKKTVLDMCFAAAQEAGWGWNYQTTATPAEIKEIKKTYDRLKSFLAVYDIDYSTYNDSQATEMGTAIKELTKYRNAANTDKKYYINNANFWTEKISDKINEISDALGNKKPAPKKKDDDITAADITKKVSELTLNSSDDEKELIKKMFDNTTEIIKGKQALLDKLAELAILIDKAFKDENSVQKSQLEAIRDDKTGKGAEAWKLAEAVKDTNNKTLTALALDKAKGKPKQDELAAAKDAAKTAMKAKMATGGEDAWKKIIENSTTLTNKELVAKTAEIFGKCYDAWKATKENEILRNELTEYSNATSGDKQAIWKAINSFTKNADNGDHTEGFATGALKHLQGLEKDRQKIVENSGATTATDAAGINASLVILEKNIDKEKIKDVVIPRVKLIGKLFEKNDDKAKELAKLIQSNFIKKLETDYDNSTYATNLKTLEDNLMKLKEFKSGGKKDVYNGLGTDEKKTFDSLIKGVEEKVNAMKEAEKKAKNNDNTETPPTPFFKSWKGILLIGVIIVAVLGAIAYFVKTNSSEEGEGE